MDGALRGSDSDRLIDTRACEGHAVMNHLRCPVAATRAARQWTKHLDCVADGHVVGGYGLGDCFLYSTNLEEPAHDFLPSTNLRKGAVTDCVQVDLE